MAGNCLTIAFHGLHLKSYNYYLLNLHNYVILNKYSYSNFMVSWVVDYIQLSEIYTLEFYTKCCPSENKQVWLLLHSLWIISLKNQQGFLILIICCEMFHFWGSSVDLLSILQMIPFIISNFLRFKFFEFYFININIRHDCNFEKWMVMSFSE